MKLAALAACSMLVLSTQKRPAASVSDPPPGGIRLLSGYRYTCDDPGPCPYGSLSKQGGVTIKYFGGQTANYVEAAREKKNVAWTRDQIVSGEKVQVAMTKDGKLLVTFDRGLARNNFVADVKSVEDASDMLLMVLGFSSPVEKAK